MKKTIPLTACAFAGVAAMTPSALNAGVASEQHGRRPNFLVILLDDVGRECISAFGGGSYTTPNIDRLAERGIKFAVNYATPMCCPSRVMFLSGKYSFRNYICWNFINPNDNTFASCLRDAGYATAMAGKWHLGGENLERPAIEQCGFDRYATYDYEGLRVNFAQKKKGNNYWNAPLMENGRPKLVENYYMQDYYADFLGEFIHENKTKPFLAWLSLDLLHRPFVKAPDGDDPRWPAGPVPTDELGNKGSLENFPGMVAAMDRVVGRLVKILDEAGVGDNTIIIFTADNGTDNIGVASRLRLKYKGREVMGGKYMLTDVGVNVPLIVCAPRQYQAGVETRELADFTDIMPTLLDYAGVKAPADLDGHSLRPIIETGKGAREWVYSWGVMFEERSSATYQLPILNKAVHLHALRDQRWKYFSDGKFYDMDNDPFEEHPLAGELSAEASAARKRLSGELAKLRGSRPAFW